MLQLACPRGETHMTEKIIGAFERECDARAAIARLIQNGVPAEHINLSLGRETRRVRETSAFARLRRIFNLTRSSASLGAEKEPRGARYILRVAMAADEDEARRLRNLIEGEGVHEAPMARAARAEASGHIGSLSSELRSYHAESFPGDEADYERFAPAYRFGDELGRRDELSELEWNEVEPRARVEWEAARQGEWEHFKNPIQLAFERARSRAPGRRSKAGSAHR